MVLLQDFHGTLESYFHEATDALVGGVPPHPRLPLPPIFLVSDGLPL
jgi:hypothetical protein